MTVAYKAFGSTDTKNVTALEKKSFFEELAFIGERQFYQVETSSTGVVQVFQVPTGYTYFATYINLHGVGNSGGLSIWKATCWVNRNAFVAGSDIVIQCREGIYGQCGQAEMNCAIPLKFSSGEIIKIQSVGATVSMGCVFVGYLVPNSALF